MQWLTCSVVCRRKQREAKKYSKQVQAERIKEKAQTKKASISSISRSASSHPYLLLEEHDSCKI